MKSSGFSKRLFVGVAFSFLAHALGHATVAAAALPPSEVNSPLEKAFVPGDYDDNDNVEIVLMGSFPNTCYKTAAVSSKVDQEAKIISIRATSYAYDQNGAMCASARIPFIQTINLGLLGAGRYTIQINEGEGLQAQLAIHEHRVSSPDDFLYAPIDSIIAPKVESLLSEEVADGDARPRVILAGTYPRMFIGCMKMDKISLSRERDDLLVVKPIARIAPEEECHSSDPLHFTQEVNLPSDLPHKSLIHVRVTNGNSLNQILF